MLPSRGRVCDQCGDVGFLELLVMCSSCSRTQKHTYCMDKKLNYVPEEWYCGDCLPATNVIPDNSKTISLKSRETEVPIKQSFGQNSTKRLSKWHTKPPKNTKVKFLPDEEVASLNTGKLAKTSSWVIEAAPASPQTNEERRHVDPSCGRVADDVGLKKFQGKQGSVVPANEKNKQGGNISSKNCLRFPPYADKGSQFVAHSPPAYSIPNSEALRKGKGSMLCSDAELEKENVDLPSQVIVILDEKHPDLPSSRPFWKGSFEVSDGTPYMYCKMHGYLPGKLDLRAFQAAKKFPEKLKFKLLPRRNVWPKAFGSDPPTDQDVGLFFFPSDDGRSKVMYSELLLKVEKDDFALRSSLGNWDLVVYTSKQLPQNSKVTAMVGHFFWGLFLTMKKKAEHKLKVTAGEKEQGNKNRMANLGAIREDPATTPSFETTAKRYSKCETEATGRPSSSHQPSSSCPPSKSSPKGSLRGSSNISNRHESSEAAVRFSGTQSISPLGRAASTRVEIRRIRSAISTRPSKRLNAREAIDKCNGERSLQPTPKSTSSKPFGAPGTVPPSGPELEVHEESSSVPPGFYKLANASVPRR